MRKIDYVCVFLCAVAAALALVGSPVACVAFCISSTVGLVDAIRGKVLPAALINGIFLVLNLYNVFRLFI